MFLVFIGRVLNIFSKDQGFLDDQLPFQMCESLLVSCIGWSGEMLCCHDYCVFFSLTHQWMIHFIAIALTIVIVNVWIIIPLVLLSVVIPVFRWYYLKTAREVKRLEAIGQSQFTMHIMVLCQFIYFPFSFSSQSILLSSLYHYTWTGHYQSIQKGISCSFSLPQVPK